ncbi:MAG: hypothetical protein JWM51_2081, partial [Microbacteriaceae bacterium]|nr:hypothetical protein [Microbacteriaceae bacterium]
RRAVRVVLDSLAAEARRYAEPSTGATRVTNQ